MLTIGVNEEYDEWDDEEKAILIVQLVMLCLGNVLHNNYRPLADLSPKIITAFQRSSKDRKATAPFEKLL